MMDDFDRRFSEIYNMAQTNRIEALEEAYLLFKWIDGQPFNSSDYDDAVIVIDALIEDIKGSMRDKHWRNGG